MGGRGSSSGKASTGGAGSVQTFERRSIPILKSGGIKGQETVSVDEVQGYSTKIDGYQVNIQKVESGYRGNAYGLLMQSTYRTLSEAKAGVTEEFQNMLNSENMRRSIEMSYRTMNMLLDNGGSLSVKDYRRKRTQLANEYRKELKR